jgi:hypothetical protein
MPQETSPQNPAPHGKFDPFSSSWLYPKEWNLSDFHGEQSQDVGESRPGMDGPNPAELPDDPIAANKGQMMPDSYEPFQELRTIPSGWDLS